MLIYKKITIFIVILNCRCLAERKNSTIILRT